MSDSNNRKKEVCVKCLTTEGDWDLKFCTCYDQTFSKKHAKRQVMEKTFLESVQGIIDWGKDNIPSFEENQISDGYHTFDELYEFRKVYNAALFKEWSEQGKYEVHKSIRHNDGELCFGGGWFIVVAILPTGQISNHYKIADWDLFKIEAFDKAKYPFDGHSGKDVIDRLNAL